MVLNSEFVCLNILELENSKGSGTYLLVNRIKNSISLTKIAAPHT